MSDDEALHDHLQGANQALYDIAALARPLAGDHPAFAEIADAAEKALRRHLARRMGVAPDIKPGYVSVRLAGPTEAHRKRWARWVLDVDPKAINGHGVDGPFLKVGTAVSLLPYSIIIEHETGPDDTAPWTGISALNPSGMTLLEQHVGRRWFLAMRSALLHYIDQSRQLRAPKEKCDADRNPGNDAGRSEPHQRNWL